MVRLMDQNVEVYVTYRDQYNIFFQYARMWHERACPQVTYDRVRGGMYEDPDVHQPVTPRDSPMSPPKLSRAQHRPAAPRRIGRVAVDMGQYNLCCKMSRMHASKSH